MEPVGWTRLGCADLDEDSISDLRDPGFRPQQQAMAKTGMKMATWLRNWTNADGLQYWIDGTDVFQRQPV